MNKNTGRFKVIEQFMADGIRHMHGNPGTVEQGFIDAISAYPDFQYILALEENSAVGIADGQARATHRPALVQLHSGVGLSGGTSLLYQAMRGHSPLVIIAGEAGLQYDAMDAQNAANLIDIARPFVKYAARVVHPSSLLRVIRRAIKMAATPPMGPVFVALPMDVLDATNDEQVVRTEIPVTRVAPDKETLERAADLLLGAQRPLIIMGDRVAYSGAQPELARLAEITGADVWGAESSEVNMPADHPLFRGLLGHMFGSVSSQITSRADVVVICGTYVFPEVFPALSGAFAPQAKIIAIDLDAYEIGKNFPFTLGMLSDPKETLALLSAAVDAKAPPAFRQAADARLKAAAREGEAAREEELRRDRMVRNAVPLRMSRFSEELSALLPKDAILFDEAITNSPALRRYVRPNLPGHYFETHGGSLGIGIPGAIGAKIAHPDKVCIGITGDGGAMYTIPALWTAARYGIGAKFVICNNSSYQILKVNLDQYRAERGIAPAPHPPAFDLAPPDLRFDLMAQSMGVAAIRVETPVQIRPAIERALADDKPFLIDVVLASGDQENVLPQAEGS